MSWSRNKTLIILIFILFLIFAFAFLAIMLIVNNLLNKEQENGHSLKSFIYLAATTFGTGLGCIWFRLCRAKSTYFHAIIHSISLACMLLAHKEIFQLLFDGEITKCYDVYPISVLNICIYIIQFILTFHFIVFRCGKTPRQKAFNAGLHSFIGGITFFVCITDGLLVCHKMANDAKLESEVASHLAAVCVFLYGMTVWYVILNPYFEWRRLSSMQENRNSTVHFDN